MLFRKINKNKEIKTQTVPGFAREPNTLLNSLKRAAKACLWTAANRLSRINRVPGTNRSTKLDESQFSLNPKSAEGSKDLNKFLIKNNKL